MADDPEQPIRRVGRKDRKGKLGSRKPLFPVDEAFAPPGLYQEDDAGPAAEAGDEPESPPPADEPDEPVEQVQESRFPPLAPEAPAREPQPRPAPPRRRRGCLYNLLTVFFLLASVSALAYFALLWTNPYHPLNPLPPFTPLPVIITATPLPPTATPVPTATEPPTLAPTASFTPIPAAELIQPTSTPAAFPFALVELETDYTRHASGCDWSGIAGQVQGEDVTDLTVRVGSAEADFVAVVGDAPDYGPGGFEAQLGDAPQLAPFTIQLLGPDETPLSPDYLVVTSDQCEQNVVLVTFVQTGTIP